MYRALATANEFVSRGWRVTVLTADRRTFEVLTGSDPESEQAIDPSITVVRVPFDLSRGETDLRRWSWLRAQSPLAWSGLQIVKERISFPERRYGSWRAALVAEALRIHRTDAVDLVIGTANPNVDFLPGWVLSTKHEVPYVMDYRDTWHLDMYKGTRTAGRMSRSGRWERRLLKRAVEVWFVNEPIKRWHDEEYPFIRERSHVVSNGYDPSFLDGMTFASTEPRRAPSIAFVGTVYGPMPLEAALQGWVEARATNAVIASATLDFYGRLGHFATPDLEAKSLIERFAEHGVTFCGKVSKTEVHSIYSRSEALALILGKSRFITSGKVFEYMATGLPIAALHHPSTASGAVLAGYPRAAHAASDTSEAFAAVFQRIGTMIATADDSSRTAAASWAQQFERSRQLAPRIEALRLSVERKR